MGFKRRKMKAQRATAAEKKAAAAAGHRGSNPRRCQSPRGGMERATRQAHANAIRADDRLRSQGQALVPLGAVSGLPHDQSVDLRSLDRHPFAALTSLIPSTVVPILPPARAVRGIGLPHR